MNKYAKLLLGAVSGVAFIAAVQEAKANPITDTIETISKLLSAMLILY